MKNYICIVTITIKRAYFYLPAFTYCVVLGLSARIGWQKSISFANHDSWSILNKCMMPSWWGAGKLLAPSTIIPYRKHQCLLQKNQWTLDLKISTLERGQITPFWASIVSVAKWGCEYIYSPQFMINRLSETMSVHCFKYQMCSRL